MFTSCPAVCSNQFVKSILKGKLMNTTATSESTPAGGSSAHPCGKRKAAPADVFAAALDRVDTAHRLPNGTDGTSADKRSNRLPSNSARNPWPTACEVLVEIFTPGQGSRSLASSRTSAAWRFRSSGPSRLRTPCPQRSRPPPTADPQTEAKRPQRGETRKAKKPAKRRGRLRLRQTRFRRPRRS